MVLASSVQADDGYAQIVVGAKHLAPRTGREDGTSGSQRRSLEERST